MSGRAPSIKCKFRVGHQAIRADLSERVTKSTNAGRHGCAPASRLIEDKPSKQQSSASRSRHQFSWQR